LCIRIIWINDTPGGWKERRGCVDRCTKEQQGKQDGFYPGENWGIVVWKNFYHQASKIFALLWIGGHW